MLSPTSTATPTFAGTVTPTTAPPSCVGDCDGDGAVTVDEIVFMVDVALGIVDIGSCDRADANSDGDVTVDEITSAVTNALDGCGLEAVLSFE